MGECAANLIVPFLVLFHIKNVIKQVSCISDCIQVNNRFMILTMNSIYLSTFSTLFSFCGGGEGQGGIMLHFLILYILFQKWITLCKITSFQLATSHISSIIWRTGSLFSIHFIILGHLPSTYTAHTCLPIHLFCDCSLLSFSLLLPLALNFRILLCYSYFYIV